MSIVRAQRHSAQSQRTAHAQYASSESMRKRRCTCGAEADVRRCTRRTLDGRDEIVYRVICPVCGQLGPAVPAEGKDEAVVKAEAIGAWNEMIARLRPLEA